ncbi:MAG: hypothetical protein LBS99_04075, partial [Clostridiales bacterium]|nr:hypothetical protein [Clostridiales bacterium]
VKLKTFILHETRVDTYGLVSISEIEEGAFSNCKFLGELHLGMVAKLGPKIFAGSQVKLYVEYKGKLLTSWAADWNCDAYDRKMFYYKKSLVSSYFGKK